MDFCLLLKRHKYGQKRLDDAKQFTTEAIKIA